MDARPRGFETVKYTAHASFGGMHAKRADKAAHVTEYLTLVDEVVRRREEVLRRLEYA
jgi:hypothetical protein